MLRLEAQELRTKHRNEGQRTDCGNDHDDAGYPSELLEHQTGHTLDHGKRKEHREHGESRSNYGNTHLLSRMHCSLLRLRSSFKMRRDVLENHDGVIDDHTDRYGEC